METKRVHFMGIGGAGVSAVAALAKAQGFQVSGCDLDQDSQFLKSLVREGLEFDSGHDKAHIKNADSLVISPAIESLDPDNAELSEARNKGIPVFLGEEFLAKFLLANKKVIAVSGTHGKSTTTAMIAKILEEAGMDPSVLVGAIVTDWKKNYRIGKGEFFVLEADEYKDKFLLYKPYISVITAVEMDHPEYFTSLEQIRQSFQKFVENTSFASVLGKGVELETEEPSIKILHFGKDYKSEKLNLKLIGDFNQINASLALEVARLIGVDEGLAKTGLEKFSGVGRRFEFRGEEKNIKVFDDYGHHPSAIEATVIAAREKFPDSRLWLVYQPHMYTRTKYLFDSFVETFKKIPVDQLVLVDIFAAREENKDNISSQHLVAEVGKSNAHYIGDFEKTAYYLAKNLAANDVVIMMGAGDIYKLSGLLLTKLRNSI